MDNEKRLKVLEGMTDEQVRKTLERIAIMQLEEYPMTAKDFARLIREIKEGE
jgi:hypothetical protein